MTNEISYYACRKEKGGEIIGAFSYDGVIEVNEAPSGYAYTGQKHIDDTLFSINPCFRMNDGSVLTHFFINKINKAEFDNIKAFGLAPTTHATSVTTGDSDTSAYKLSNAVGGYPELNAYYEKTGLSKPVTLVGASGNTP